MRRRFNLQDIEYDDRTCIIVVKVNNISIGLIVDEVAEVMDIQESDRAPSPPTNKGSHSKFIQSIGKVGDQVKILLDIYKLLYEENVNIFELNE